jgi:hypothetical protein
VVMPARRLANPVLAIKLDIVRLGAGGGWSARAHNSRLRRQDRVQRVGAVGGRFARAAQVVVVPDPFSAAPTRCRLAAPTEVGGVHGG